MVQLVEAERGWLPGATVREQGAGKGRVSIFQGGVFWINDGVVTV